MKRLKLITKNLLVFWLAVSILSGCYSDLVLSANRTIKKVALGMSKEQVVQILGNNYKVSSSSKDDTGDQTEILTYRRDINEEYRLKFINAQLIKWNRDLINKYIVKDSSP